MPDVNDWAMDLRLHVNRLESIVDEVERHLADGKPDSAALVLGVSAGKIHGFAESYAGLTAALRDAGADPQRALDPDS